MKNDSNSNKDLLSKFRDLNIDPILLDSRGFNCFKTNASLATISNLNSNLASYLPNQMSSNSLIIKNNTSEVLNQLGGAVEIKNNNFEINNNFYGAINIDSAIQNRNPILGGNHFFVKNILISTCTVNITDKILNIL